MSYRQTLTFLLFDEQFFALIFTWCRENPGGMNIFFSNPANQNVVEQSMSCLLEAMGVYDTDRSFRLSKTELYSMFCDQLPSHVQSGLLDRTIHEVFPKQVSTMYLESRGPHSWTNPTRRTSRISDENAPHLTVHAQIQPGFVSC